MSKSVEAIVSLGSNLGDRRANLMRAVELLSAPDGVEYVAMSPIYETEPVDVPEEFQSASYYNAVAIFQVSLPLEDWSRHCHVVEDALGRIRTGYHHPRTIDVDLLLFGDALSDKPHLHLPHPQIASRRFVCQPLFDLRPDLLVPVWNKTVRELLADLPERPCVRLA